MELATLAGGCFWCTEAIFQKLKGVEQVVSGYTGGRRENPTYEQVSTGVTGHTEAIQISFDPNVISYEQLLDVFFKTHDPTTLNRQGADEGTQYRSAIFYHSSEQKEVAEKVKSQVKDAVTEITPYDKFYEAEPYHKDYFLRNQDAPYCRIIIDPKVQKLYKDFKPLLKDDQTD